MRYSLAAKYRQRPASTDAVLELLCCHVLEHNSALARLTEQR